MKLGNAIKPDLEDSSIKELEINQNIKITIFKIILNKIVHFH